VARGEAKDGDMGKGDGGEGNKGVTEEEERWDSFPGEQIRGKRRLPQFIHGVLKAAHAGADEHNGGGSEAEKEDGLEGIDPGSATHSAEEDVAHNGNGDDGSAHPVGDEATADGF
jgi:hypothetical protein